MQLVVKLDHDTVIPRTNAIRRTEQMMVILAM
jgi:hypothetical protein